MSVILLDKDEEIILNYQTNYIPNVGDIIYTYGTIAKRFVVKHKMHMVSTMDGDDPFCLSSIMLTVVEVV